MSSETWAPVKGYEGLYEVSDLGNIKGVDRVISRNGHPMRVKGRMIRQQAMPNGYMSVNLKNSGDSKRHYVHRVVASSFLFNGANLPEVNHKDEDKKNNCVSNLEWVTRSQNLKLYTVTKVETVDHGNGCVEQTRRVIGETWAVSPGKAISNITYRKGMRKSGLTEFRGGGCVRWELVAEEVA